MRGKNNKTIFRRIRGRVVPMRVQEEASAVVATKRELAGKPAALASAARALGYVGAGFGIAFGAGKLKKLSEVALALNPASRSGAAMERGAKIAEFLSKAGTGMLAGTEVTKIDRALAKDEKSALLNIGANGVGPVSVATGLLGGYGVYRLGKRFTKWGYHGGKFPKKLRDI